jgi:hypothetical protein
MGKNNYLSLKTGQQFGSLGAYMWRYEINYQRSLGISYVVGKVTFVNNLTSLSQSLDQRVKEVNNDHAQ